VTTTPTTNNPTLLDAAEVLDEVQPKRLPGYPAYRDSGVRWLGDIPEHWRVRKLKFIADVRTSNVDKKTVDGQEPVHLCNYVDVYYNDYITSDIEFMPASATRDQIKRFKIEPGDVIITKDSEAWDDIAVPALVDQEFDDVLCGYHLALIRPDAREAIGDYLFRAFAANAVLDQFRVRANGITRFGLSRDGVTSGLFPLPPLDEQRAIAGFLRRETARIDGLVEKKRRLIELLQEKRSALISHAVTKGLNPDAPMKPSGIDWLGDVPKHWRVAALRYFAVFGTGSTPDRSNPAYWDGNIPWVKTGEIRYEPIASTEETITDEGLRNSACWIAPAGTLLIALYGQGDTRGRVAILNIPAAFNQACVAITPKKDLVVEYLHAYLEFAYRHIRNVGNESTQMNMSTEYVRRIPIAVPPVEEQIQIAAQVADARESIADIRLAIMNVNQKLAEYRAALISAAVTGKIDVRGEVTEP